MEWDICAGPQRGFAKTFRLFATLRGQYRDSAKGRRYATALSRASASGRFSGLACMMCTVASNLIFANRGHRGCHRGHRGLTPAITRGTSGAALTSVCRRRDAKGRRVHRVVRQRQARERSPKKRRSVAPTMRPPRNAGKVVTAGRTTRASSHVRRIVDAVQRS